MIIDAISTMMEREVQSSLKKECSPKLELIWLSSPENGFTWKTDSGLTVGTFSCTGIKGVDAGDVFTVNWTPETSEVSVTLDWDCNYESSEWYTPDVYMSAYTI